MSIGCEELWWKETFRRPTNDEAKTELTKTHAQATKRCYIRGPHGTGRTDLTATCAAEHQPIWAAHSSPTRRHVSRQGWNGRTEGVERRTKGVERRTRTGGTADQRGGTADQNRWNGGPERVGQRTRTGGTADQHAERNFRRFWRSCAPPRQRIYFRA